MISLITGATGFLGSHLVDELIAAGENVRVLVRLSSVPPHLRREGVEVVMGSLEDRASVHRAVEGVDRVYHCAARVADHGAWKLFHETNVIGTQHIVDACLASSVKRLVHVSTTDVYGHPDRAVDETAPHCRRGYPYGDSKIEAEERVWAAHHRHGLPTVVFRPASIYGPRCVPFVAEIAEALQGGYMFRVGREKKAAGLAYVTNVTDALRLGAASDAAIGRVLNVHDGLPVSWEEYVDGLADRLGLRRPRLRLPFHVAYGAGLAMELAWKALPLPGRPLLSRLAVDLLGTHQGFDTSHVRARLVWSPRVGLEDGLDRCANWWKHERKRSPR